MRKTLWLFLLFACIQIVHAQSNPVITVDNAHQLQALYTVDRDQVYVSFSEFNSEELALFLVTGEVIDDRVHSTIETWDLGAEEIANTITFQSGGYIGNPIQIPEQSRMVTISIGGAIYVQNYPSGDIEAEFISSSVYYTSISSSADGSTLVYTECEFMGAMQGGCDPTSWYLRIVDLQTSEFKNTMYIPDYEVQGLALSADGQHVLVQTPTGSLIVWDTSTAQQIASKLVNCQLDPTIGSMTRMFVSETTILVAERVCKEFKGQVKTWNFETDEERIILGDVDGEIRHIALSPDDTVLGVLIGKGQNAELYLLDFDTGQILTQIETDGYSFDFSSDGRYIVVGRNPSVVYGIEQ